MHECRQRDIGGVEFDHLLRALQRWHEIQLRFVAQAERAFRYLDA